MTDGWRGKEEEYYRNRDSLDPNSNMIFGIKQLGVYAQQFSKRQEMIQRNMYGDNILGRNIRDVFGVTHIIDANEDEFEIMENKTALPDVRVGQNIIKIRDMGEALGGMNQSVFDPQTDVLWESEITPNADEEVILVNRSYYPGWRAFLSGKEIPIYPVNINQQAVIVPENTSLSALSFRYCPRWLVVGLVVSVISFTVWAVFIVRLRGKSILLKIII